MKDATRRNTGEDTLVVRIWDRVTWFFKFYNIYEPARKVFDFFAIFFLEKRFRLKESREFYTYDFRESVFNNEKELTEQEGKLFRAYWQFRYDFIDIWTILCMLTAMVASLILYYLGDCTPKAVLYIVFFCVEWRILEIASRHTQTALFESVKGKQSVHVRNISRSILLLFHNIAELVFLFSILQMIAIALSGNPMMCDQRPYYIFVRESFLSFITLNGYSNLERIDTSISHIISFEVLLGFWVEMIALARFCGMLPSILLQENMGSDKH